MEYPLIPRRLFHDYRKYSFSLELSRCLVLTTMFSTGLQFIVCLLPLPTVYTMPWGCKARYPPSLQLLHFELTHL